MESIQQFIFSPTFYSTHGFGLILIWFFGVVFAILARRLSSALHGILFFILDMSTFFLGGCALIRVYSTFSGWSMYSPLFILHMLGGSLFLILVLIQHIGGVNTLLKSLKNKKHHVFGFIVSNSGRCVAVVGSILAHKSQQAIILAIITILLLCISAYVTFKPQQPRKHITDRPKRH